MRMRCWRQFKEVNSFMITFEVYLHRRKEKWAQKRKQYAHSIYTYRYLTSSWKPRLHQTYFYHKHFCWCELVLVWHWVEYHTYTYHIFKHHTYRACVLNSQPVVHQINNNNNWKRKQPHNNNGTQSTTTKIDEFEMNEKSWFFDFKCRT